MSLRASKRTTVFLIAVVVVVVDVVVCVVAGVVGVVVVTAVVLPRVAKNTMERRTNKRSVQARAGVTAFLTSWAKE